MTSGMVSQPSTIAGQLPISSQPTTFTQQAPQNQTPRPPFSLMPGMGPTGGEGGINVSNSQQGFAGLPPLSTKPGSSLGLGQSLMASNIHPQRMTHPTGIAGQQQQGGTGMIQQVGGMGMSMIQPQMMQGSMGVMQQQSASSFPSQQQAGVVQQGTMMPSSMGGGVPPQLQQPHHAGMMQTQQSAGMPRQPLSQTEKLKLFLQNCPPEQKQV